MKQVGLGRVLSFRLVTSIALIVLAVAQIAGTAPPVSAQGTATIEITNTDVDTGQPAPFTRFQVTSENGTVYGPLETDLNGYVSFSVVVDPQGTSFTVEEETPPACASAPDPQTTDPLQADDSTSLSFTTQDNPGCGLGTIALYAMACPEGFSGPVDDYGPWRDGCTGTNDGIGFTLTSTVTGESWNPIAGAYGIPGRAPVNGLPSGDYTFQQSGDTPSAVFCLVYDTANYATSPEPSSVLPVTLENGIGTISLTGNRVSCDVFTVPGGAIPVVPSGDVESASGASLEVHLSQCPAGYVPGDAIYDDCHGNGIDGREISLYTTSGGTFSAHPYTVVESTPGPGIARFSGLPDGNYTLTSNADLDTEIWGYCSDADGNEFPIQSDEYTKRAIYFDLASGDAVTCDIYEIPGGLPPASTNSYLEMHALQCPAGTTTESDLYDLCHSNGIDGMTFKLYGLLDGYSDQQTTTVPNTPGPGIATFEGLVAQQYIISPQGVDSGSTFSIYCSLADSDAVVDYTYPSLTLSIALDLPADTGVVCDWYAIPPSTDTTTLQISVYECPTNFSSDENTPLTVFQDACQPSTGTTTQYSITPNGGEQITQTVGSAGVGMVLFSSLPTNSYRLGTSIPGDFNDPYVFCGVEGGDLLPGFRLDIDASQGPYVCQWFNDPYIARGESETLTITNYLCPPGTNDAYADRCASTPLEGATFVLDWDGPGGTEELDAVADVDGVASISGFLLGSNLLTNTPPVEANVAVYVVACEANGEPFDFTYDDQQSMSIALDLPAGVDLHCNWYNIPPAIPTVTPTVAPEQSGGSITVHKFLCQGKSVNAYNWDADCAVQTTPAGFSLKTADGRPIAAGSTDGSGLLKYTGLANGAYSLDETSGDWCHAEADLVDSGGNVLVSNSSNTDVYIYNCSIKQVGALPSTGTGADSTTSSAEFDREKRWELLLAAAATLGIAFLTRHHLQRAALGASRTDEDPAPIEHVDDLV